MSNPPTRTPACGSVVRWAASAVATALLGLSTAASLADATTRTFEAAPEFRHSIACENLQGKYTYQFAWNGIPSAQSEVVISLDNEHGQPYYRIEGTARTSAFADIFWKFRAHAVALVDAVSGRANRIHISEQENAVSEETATVFNHELSEAYYVRWKKGREKSKTISLEGGIMDLADFGLTLCCLPLDVENSGSLKVLIGDDPYAFDYRVISRERVRVARRDFDAIRVVPTFRKLEAERKGKPPKVREMTVWLSGPEPHIPLKMKSRTFIGHVTGTLVQALPARPVSEQESAAASPVNRRMGDITACSETGVPVPPRALVSMGRHWIPGKARHFENSGRATIVE